MAQLNFQVRCDDGTIEEMKSKALFVTGTDTGVGKTVVTALVALKLRQMGIHCGVMKPFASGCYWENGVLVSEDAAFLRDALQLDDTQDEICPIRLEEPLAPLIAARRAAISTGKWPEMAREAFLRLQLRYECVVVEGVGGLLAPIWEDGAIRTNQDLIENWELPTVVVARSALGTINHTLLTLQRPLMAPATFAGIVFNDSNCEVGDVASQTSPHFIAENTEVPVWGTLPFIADLSREWLQQAAQTLSISF
ncbi:dethiobiotin synthase [bacterium]|nr:MAG: dethiobiotin synthase [bacterium]